MTSTEVRVSVNGSQFPIVSLTLENKLSDIRETLKNNSIIKMDDTLLFSKKIAAPNIIRFAEISRENEDDFKLIEIIEKVENGVETLYTLYLIKSSRPYWQFLNVYKLDFGCTMTFDGIVRANKRAFKTVECELTEISTNKITAVEFSSDESVEDWMMKKNLFFIPDMNTKYFAKLGIKYESKELESFKDQYQVIEKASFKLYNLKATENFIEEVNEAIELNDPKKFKQITGKFGQFIPIEVILGRRVQIGDTEDQTNDEKKALNYYRNWDIIEFRKPISIFELIDDNLDNKLRKDVYSFFGKRILYTEIQELNKYFKEVIDLPRTISKIISNKHADCSIFATVVGMKDYYHCQILTSPGNKPKLMIHCFRENSKDSKVVIGWMVIGYDTNFKSIFFDCNTRLDGNTRFEILEQDYNPSEIENSVEFDLNSPTERPVYVGIPVIDNSNLMIGHYFSNSREKLYTFAYNIKEKKQVKLPKFRFNLLKITNYNNLLIMFEKNMNNNIIDLDKHGEFKKLKNIPKFVSLYSNKNKHGPILLKQRFTQIKVKSFGKKLSYDDFFKCSFFIPFESSFFKSPRRHDTKEMPFSKFSSLLDDIVKVSEEIIKSIQLTKNNGEILEQFQRRAFEVEKIVKNLKACHYQYNYFFNKDNLTLLKNLVEDIKTIEKFVKGISQFKEISQSRILIISNIKKLYDARKFRESFDKNFDKIQKFMENSKEQATHYNEDLTDIELSIISKTPSAPIEISIGNTSKSLVHDNKNGGVATKSTTTTLPISPKSTGNAIEEETSIGNESNEIVDADKIILQDEKIVKTGGSEIPIKNQIKVNEINDTSNTTTAGDAGKTETVAKTITKSSAHENKNDGVVTKTISNTAKTITLPTLPKSTSITIEEEISIGIESNEFVDGDKINLQGGKMVKTSGSEIPIKNQTKVSEIDDKSNTTTAGETETAVKTITAHENKNDGVVTKTTYNTTITVTVRITIKLPKLTSIENEKETSIDNESNENVNSDKINLQDKKMVKTGDKSNTTTEIATDNYELNEELKERYKKYGLCKDCKQPNTGYQYCQSCEQKYLSDDIYEQIKDFNIYKLTEEQNLLIDKLIINEELKKRYKENGLCKECKQPNTGWEWCQSCNAEHFQQNFINWTSGNYEVDKLIQESQINAKGRYKKLEWIEYDKFENIEYITKGGFGTIYKAFWKEGWIINWDYKTNQWSRFSDETVALKSLNNSKNITLEFLNEINLHLKTNGSFNIIRIYGITKDPKTSNFMIVMEYADKGNLRQRLNSDFNSLSLNNKLDILRDISCGLSDIHKMELIHQDFHSGNILSSDKSSAYYRITDLGLCKPANEKSEKDNKKVYGVLPYVAPEVLSGKQYTKGSDVYSFGMIIYEVINGLPPYYDIPYNDEDLAIKICHGLRPSFNIKVPQLIVDIFKQCVDADPSKRPTASYLHEKFNQWHNDINYEDSEIYKQIKEADEFNEKQPSFTKSDNTKLTYTTHHQAIYTSRLLNFNNLPEPKNAEFSGN
ncbi:hypothetical protein C1645_833427 [Glomus cerebriforme]|uniref:Protein kinase domain-containing protein n=1 Tax=Glomus cerebriforme TaxID=658196 RepID=A0A397SG48_9GLOM|nr:hypothetical protein C1645_833427 [Glomus cerebriforme]